jgi:hypothetical protein
MCSFLDCLFSKFSLHNLPLGLHILVGLHAENNPLTNVPLASCNIQTVVETVFEVHHEQFA